MICAIAQRPDARARTPDIAGEQGEVDDGRRRLFAARRIRDAGAEEGGGRGIEAGFARRGIAEKPPFA